MNNTILISSETFRNAEAHGLVFSGDGKTHLECRDKGIAGAVIPEGVAEIAANAFERAACEEQVKLDYPHLFE